MTASQIEPVRCITTALHRLSEAVNMVERPLFVLGLTALLFAAGSAVAAPRRQKPEPVPQNAISADYEYEAFEGSFSPWTLASIEGLHRFGFGPVIARVNRARRFGESGTQLEVDSYPKLGHGMYLYANAGVSGQRIFPRTRVGAELYKSLSNAWEASAGFRQLNFRSASVTLLTGTVAKYRGNNYYSVRPYLALHGGRTSASAQATARKYFATADEYASIVATYGKSPTENIAPDAVDLLTSWNLRLSAQHALIRKLIVNAHVGYSDEQIRLATHRRGWSVGAGVQRRF